jgi:hypothetical protein
VPDVSPPVPTRSTLAPPDGGECRACAVACDRVVYPSSCLQRGCPNLYCYEDAGGRRYVGCGRQVFRPELDLDLLEAAMGTRAGFGALKCSGEPLAMCDVAWERAYEERLGERGCVNPEFFEPVSGAFRVIWTGGT